MSETQPYTPEPVNPKRHEVFDPSRRRFLGLLVGGAATIAVHEAAKAAGIHLPWVANATETQAGSSSLNTEQMPDEAAVFPPETTMSFEELIENPQDLTPPTAVIGPDGRFHGIVQASKKDPNEFSEYLISPYFQAYTDGGEAKPFTGFIDNLVQPELFNPKVAAGIDANGKRTVFISGEKVFPDTNTVAAQLYIGKEGDQLKEIPLDAWYGIDGVKMLQDMEGKATGQTLIFGSKSHKESNGSGVGVEEIAVAIYDDQTGTVKEIRTHLSVFDVSQMGGAVSRVKDGAVTLYKPSHHPFQEDILATSIDIESGTTESRSIQLGLNKSIIDLKLFTDQNGNEGLTGYDAGNKIFSFMSTVDSQGNSVPENLSIFPGTTFMRDKGYENSDFAPNEVKITPIDDQFFVSILGTIWQDGKEQAVILTSIQNEAKITADMTLKNIVHVPNNPHFEAQGKGTTFTPESVVHYDKSEVPMVVLWANIHELGPVAVQIGTETGGTADIVPIYPAKGLEQPLATPTPTVTPTEPPVTVTPTPPSTETPQPPQNTVRLPQIRR